MSVLAVSSQSARVGGAVHAAISPGRALVVVVATPIALLVHWPLPESPPWPFPAIYSEFVSVLLS